MSFLFYIVFSLCCVYACCDEPFGCSQSFTFIEKTLDKVIRTEVKVETIEKHITETNTAVKTSLDELKREREETKKETNAAVHAALEDLKREHEETKKETNAAVQAALEDLKREREETKKETNAAVHAALEDLKREREEIKKEKNDFEAFFENQTNELKRQREETRIYLENQRNKNEEKMAEFFNKNTLTTPTVLFKARTLSDQSVQEGQVLIFTENMLNYGDGYDNKTGVFTASVSGTYLFTFHLCVTGGHQMFYGLVHNGNVHTAGYFYDSSIGSCYTADGMLYLEVGDTVSIKCLYSSASLYEYNKPTYSYKIWNTFSGMLIHQ